MLGVNACVYVIIPFRMTHSRKGATDLLKNNTERNIGSIQFFPPYFSNFSLLLIILYKKYYYQ